MQQPCNEIGRRERATEIDGAELNHRMQFGESRKVAGRPFGDIEGGDGVRKHHTSHRLLLGDTDTGLSAKASFKRLETDMQSIRQYRDALRETVAQIVIPRVQ